MLGLIFALIALGAGWGACRLLRCSMSLAPSLGLAVLAVLASSCVGLGVPLVFAMAGVVVVLLVGVRRELRPKITKNFRPKLGELALVVAAAGPALILGLTLAPLATPISNHDGAFHVETIDALRRGQFVPGWYPIGFHTAVAA